MTPQHTNIPDSHLDVYLNGIRQKFSRLNLELDEARNERDEYKKNCIYCFVNLLVDHRLTLKPRHESSERATGTPTKSFWY